MAQRPDLEVVSLRGNVWTPLRKLTEGSSPPSSWRPTGGMKAPRPVRAQVPARPARVHPRRGAGRARHRIPRGPAEISPKCCLSWNTVRPASAWKPNAACSPGSTAVRFPSPDMRKCDDGTFELEGLVGEVDGSVIIRRKVTGRADEARAVGFAGPVLAEDGGAGSRPGVRAVSFPPPGCSGCRSLALTCRRAPQGKPIPFETGRVLFKAKTFGRGGHGEGRDSLSSERFSLPSPRSF